MAGVTRSLSGRLRADGHRHALRKGSALTVGGTSPNAATRTQHAIRLLVLLRVAGDPVGGSDPAGMAQVIRSEKRLQALDFWLRNPDYLADELVTAVEAGALDASYLGVAESLLTDPEPAWHHYPMPKWFYGAYEEVDDAFAILQAYGLGLVRRRGAPPKPLRNQFFLTEFGAEKADELATTDVLSWYSRQAKLVHQVAGSDSGSMHRMSTPTRSGAPRSVPSASRSSNGSRY